MEAKIVKVSVVIPTYNRAHLLVECLSSVLSQSFRDFEIIVIDDGSTDNTREMISTLPVTYIWQENQGPPAAFNKGIEQAKGEYIAILGSDDTLLNNALAKGVEVLDQCPEVAFSYGQAYLVDENGTVFGLEKPRSSSSYVWDGKDEIRELITFGNHITGSTVMIRRSCLEDVGTFRQDFRSGSEDLDLWIRLARRYSVAYIAEPLAKFRAHYESFSAKRSLSEWETTNSSIFESVFNDTDLGPLFSRLKPATYVRLYLAFADRALFREERRIALSYLVKALRVYPQSLVKDFALSWIFILAKTLFPQPILSVGRKIRRSLRGSRLSTTP